MPKLPGVIFTRIEKTAIKPISNAFVNETSNPNALYAIKKESPFNRILKREYTASLSSNGLSFLIKCHPLSALFIAFDKPLFPGSFTGGKKTQVSVSVNNKSGMAHYLVSQSGVDYDTSGEQQVMRFENISEDD